MKLATVAHDNTPLVVALHATDNTATPLLHKDGTAFPSMQALIQFAQDEPGYQAKIVAGTAIALDSLQWLAPIPQPRRNILCVGKNYREHAKEFTQSGFDSSASSLADAIPKAPIVFTKFPETVIGPNADIRYPHGASKQLDYEAELGVIIGRTGTNISKADALKHIFGYTIINDVTARDRQATHKQWFLGKSLDTFCPMGPWILTAEEFELDQARVRCWVNGELRQDACTADLIFDVPTLIETISQGITLLPGDIIATGTPAGVGIGLTPPRFLSVGDEIAIEIDKLGRLVNRVA